MNPFEVLKAGGFGSSEEDIHAAVEHIIEHPNDDLVAMAKETGRDVYSELSLPQRKQKLNAVVSSDSFYFPHLVLALVVGFLLSKIFNF